MSLTIDDRKEIAFAAASISHYFAAAGLETDRQFIFEQLLESAEVNNGNLTVNAQAVKLRRRRSLWRWLAWLFVVAILSGCIPAYTTVESDGLRDRTFTTYHDDGITVKSNCSWSSFIIGGIKQTHRSCEWFREDGSRMWKSGKNELIPTKQRPAKQIVPDISPPGRFNQT